MGFLARTGMCLLLIIMTFAWAVPAGAESAPASDDSTLVHRVVELTNQERMKAGLLPLKWNDSLAASASAYARDMAARNFFSHNSPEGTTAVDRARVAGYQPYGWGGLYVGENLARAYATAEGAMQGWMASEGHRDNLLNPKYREIGVGVAVAPSGARVWAQEFGCRPKTLPVFLNGDAATSDSPRVTLSVSSEDVSSWGSLSKMAGMMVSNDPAFAGAVWEPYTATRAWTLKYEAGPQRVYVRLKDADGVTTDSSDEIQLTRSWIASLSESQSALSLAGEMPQSQPQLAAVAAAPAMEFRLGFKLLADRIPDVVGWPTENERWGANGDSHQQTTAGLMVWRKADDWTAFTNGARTWINGPLGVQGRPNDQKFEWEK